MLTKKKHTISFLVLFVCSFNSLYSIYFLIVNNLKIKCIFNSYQLALYSNSILLSLLSKDGDFLKNNYKLKSFKDKKDAEKVLLDSRKRIDEIDNEIFDLICQRTSFAMDIALAKDYIGMPVYDKKREDSIHKKIGELSEKNHIDVDISNQIMDMLTTLSKNEQKEILRRNVNG